MKNDAIISAWNEIESDDATKSEILSDIIIRQRKQAKRLKKKKNSGHHSRCTNYFAFLMCGGRYRL